MFSSAQAPSSPAHLLQHLVAFVVSSNSCVDCGDLDARGLQGVISPLVDRQREVAICAQDRLLPPFSLHMLSKGEQRVAKGPIAVIAVQTGPFP